jgi:hypothetical protein
MPHVRLDENFPGNPKIASISNDALALWVVGLAYCNSNRTDGFIPTAVGYGQLRYCNGSTEAAVGDLERIGLWETTKGGWNVHDYCHYQTLKADQEELRRLRSEAGRRGGQISSRAKDKHLLKQMPSKTQANAQASAGLKDFDFKPLPASEVQELKPLAAKKEKPRDPLWDALTEIFHASAEGLERDKWNAALKSLRSANATPEQLRAAAATWPKVFSGATMTAIGIARNWTTLTAQAKSPEELERDRLRDRFARLEGGE